MVTGVNIVTFQFYLGYLCENGKKLLHSAHVKGMNELVNECVDVCFMNEKGQIFSSVLVMVS
jgi:hypothetical protein